MTTPTPAQADEKRANLIAWMSMNAPYHHMMTFKAIVDEAALLPSSPEAQAGSPAEALPSQTSGVEIFGWFEPYSPELGGSLIDRFRKGPVKPFDWSHRAFPVYRAKPASERAGGGVLREAGIAFADQVEVLLSADTDMPTYQQDYDDTEAALETFRAALSSPASSPAEAEALPAGVEAEFPGYGEMSFGELGRAVMAARYGQPEPFAFDPEFYPGHQIVGTINFNSLNRIVTWFVKRALSPAPAQAGSFVASATPELEPNDWLLLDRLARDNRHDGARLVIEKDQAAWDQAFRLSTAGLIAIEQISVGGVLHITRLGTKTLDQFLSDSKPALADAPSNGSAPAGEER
ncbi:MAG: hypothetical protein DI537_20435 [Stutzerimonas stutzeri]|nr:MAG: hypothetical protein DI537_20435 [Stutzerimonas stutzeri]